MMSLRSGLAVFVLQGLWQVPLLWAAGVVICRIGGRLRPVLQYRLWIGILFAQFLLPALSAGTFSGAAVLAMVCAWLPGRTARSSWGTITSTTGPIHAHSGLLVPSVIWIPLLALYLVLTARHLLRLVCGAMQLRRLRQSSRPAQLDSEGWADWEASRGRFGLQAPDLVVTDRPVGMLTIGWRHKVVVVQAGMLQDLSQSDRQAAFAHECAHMQRNDFAWNLMLQLFALPISYQPFTHASLRQIAEARELICDERAATAVGSRVRYAQSLLRLAARLLPAQPVFNLSAVGMLDANTFERRLMRLQQKSSILHRPQVVAIVTTGVFALAGTWTTASALHLAVRASGSQQQAAAAAPVQVSSGVEAGNALTKVPPVYPQEAREARITGSVVLRAVIDESGKIARLDVVSGPAELTQSALDAVRQWTYKPYLLHGQPTSVETTITVNYDLG